MAIENIQDITYNYLEKEGFDGLANSDLECGCPLQDLIPCGEPHLSECLPGYKHLQDDGDWLMGITDERTCARCDVSIEKNQNYCGPCLKIMNGKAHALARKSFNP